MKILSMKIWLDLMMTLAVTIFGFGLRVTRRAKRKSNFVKYLLTIILLSLTDATGRIHYGPWTAFASWRGNVTTP